MYFQLSLKIPNYLRSACALSILYQHFIHSYYQTVYQNIRIYILFQTLLWLSSLKRATFHHNINVLRHTLKKSSALPTDRQFLSWHVIKYVQYTRLQWPSNVLSWTFFSCRVNIVMQLLNTQNVCSWNLNKYHVIQIEPCAIWRSTRYILLPFALIFFDITLVTFHFVPFFYIKVSLFKIPIFQPWFFRNHNTKWITTVMKK